jgi:uncharacterized protein YaiE (UPF0345 family)
MASLKPAIAPAIVAPRLYQFQATQQRKYHLLNDGCKTMNFHTNNPQVSTVIYGSLVVLRNTSQKWNFNFHTILFE